MLWIALITRLLVSFHSKHTFLLLFPVPLTDSECVGVRVLLWIPTQNFSRSWTTVALEREQNNHYFSIKLFQYKTPMNSLPSPASSQENPLCFDFKSIQSKIEKNIIVSQNTLLSQLLCYHPALFWRQTDAEKEQNGQYLKKHWLRWGLSAQMSIMIVTPLSCSDKLYDGELIFTALMRGNDHGFNLCSFALFCIPQDLMKQGPYYKSMLQTVLRSNI